MPTQQDIYRREFEQCKTDKDFDDYFIKYYYADDNPYIKLCKNKIKVRSRESLTMPVVLFICSCVFCAVMVIGQYNSSGARDSTDRIAYAIISFVCTFPFVVGTAVWIFKTLKKRRA